MNYNQINFLLSGNGTSVQVPPKKLIGDIDIRGRMKLHEEIYDFEEELEKVRLKLAKLFQTVQDKYRIKVLDIDGNPTLDPRQQPVYETEDTIENGETKKIFKLTDRVAYDKDVKELFDSEVTFKSKFTPSLLEGVVQIGKLEYRWLRELDLLKH